VGFVRSESVASVVEGLGVKVAYAAVDVSTLSKFNRLLSR
jgi:hypothetical protein